MVWPFVDLGGRAVNNWALGLITLNLTVKTVKRGGHRPPARCSKRHGIEQSQVRGVGQVKFAIVGDLLTLLALPLVRASQVLLDGHQPGCRNRPIHDLRSNPLKLPDLAIHIGILRKEVSPFPSAH